ncbi:MAG: acyltransferase [Ottowia sp.]|uniref:acyltransferase family protein n=1 Tax=Ottowia sp. TaxID=1898956 RepID=UPI0039E5A870
MPVQRPPASAEHRLVFLDYLRIFAFGSVLAGHKFWEPLWAAVSSPDSPWHWPAWLLWPWVRFGGVGVLVFFLVSGYIITHVLQRERTAEFLLKRAFRIYPLYLAAVLGEGAWLAAEGRAPELPTLLRQMTLLGDWMGTPYALGSMGVEWTLRIELAFYVLMAALKASGLVDWHGGAALPWLYALLAAALWAAGPWPTHTGWALGYLSLYFPCLLLGSAIQLGERGAVRWGVVLGLGALVLLLQYAGLKRWQPGLATVHLAPLAVGLFLLLWACRRRLPAPAWVLGLSELTYAVYLFHNWVFDIVRDAAQGWGWAVGAARLLALVALLALCAALVRGIEQPAIRLGRRLARRFGPRRAV